MKLSKEELAALGKLSEPEVIDQDARYRDSAGRTLTEIQQASVVYELNPAREGLMCYDGPSAEYAAKMADSRYTRYKNTIYGHRG